MINNPDDINLGQLTDIYNKIKEEFHNLGFEIDWKGTSQTKQIFLPRSYYLKNQDAVRKQIGAIEYYRINNTRTKTSVSFRFYRSNLPNNEWKEKLEELINPYRQDKITGDSVDPKSIQIQFVFYSYDKNLDHFFNELRSILEKLLISL
ncbi:MAG: hypothetical protein PHO01_02895 [Desulfotomaculaceae bacterium]|nr:hypothetical protein [Desulfotomaculaceae bacterium]